MMRKARVLLAMTCTMMLAGCGGDAARDDVDAGMTATSGLDAGGADAGPGRGPAQATHDIEREPLPKLVVHDYIELAKIMRIGRFRSGIGHDYADSVEHCRSMKHYFQPAASVAWSTVRIDAPFAGTVVRLDEEWAGKQIHVRSTDNSAFTLVIFHVQTDPRLTVGSQVEPGQMLGTHVGSQTMSDVAVQVNTPGGFRLVSYFALMTDAVMAAYQARGVASDRALIIERAERDADPLGCMGEAFSTMGTLENWVVLN